jgi:phosphate butyryltransferase
MTLCAEQEGNMMLRTFADLKKIADAKQKRMRTIAVAAHDLHTLEGLDAAYRARLIEPVLIGDRNKIEALIDQEALSLSEAEIINESDDFRAAKKAVEIIRNGEGDILMKGRMQTADMLREVVSKETGLPVTGTISHIGLFQIPGRDRLAALTDGGMVIAPNVDQKQQIIENAVRTLRALGYSEPNVAVLCAAETVNPKIQASMDAVTLKERNCAGLISGCTVEGPISFDLMYDKEAATIKGYESPISGNSDIWLMPDMTAGNLVAKSLMCAAKAQMAGIIIGAKVPIVLVSRGATAEEKYWSLVFAAATTT